MSIESVFDATVYEVREALYKAGYRYVRVTGPNETWQNDGESVSFRWAAGAVGSRAEMDQAIKDIRKIVKLVAIRRTETRAAGRKRTRKVGRKNPG